MSRPHGADDDRDLLLEAERLIAALEAHPDAAVRRQLDALLQAIDAVHRAGLGHLVDAIRAMAGDAFVNRLVADPAIRLLLMSYDLVPIDRRLQAEEALDAVRGHLHARGVDVELREVVGGVVYARLHGLQPGGVSEQAVRKDIEVALREGFVGFQELVLRDRHAGAGAVVPLESLKRARKPVYRAALRESELAGTGLKAVELLGQPLLLVRLDAELYAVRNRCGDSPLPLEFGSLAGAELRCSWHGCRYDVRSGRRLDGGTDRLAVFPVRVSDGLIEVAIATEPAAAP